jgi:GcrA cell cycle regulator
MNAHVSPAAITPGEDTQTAAILRLAKDGAAQKQIAETTGLDYAYVANVLWKLRQRGLLEKPKPSWSDEDLGALRDCILVKGMGPTKAAAFLTEKLGRPLSRKMIVSMCVRRGWRAGAADAAQAGLRDISKSRTWPDEHLAALREACLVERLSGAATAAALSAKFGREFTRNSVIGMARRLGLSFTAQTGRPRRDVALDPTPRTAREVSPARRAKPARAHLVEALEEWEPRRLTLLALREGDCKFPIGDPGAGEFASCGAPIARGKTYCAHCARVAYETPAERARKRKAWCEARGLPVKSEWNGRQGSNAP